MGALDHHALSALLCVMCVACAQRVDARRTNRNGLRSGGVVFREQCALKAESGPCRAIRQRHFFHVDSGRCETFEFGGCGGNDNNFLSREECEETCVVTGDKDPCRLPEAPGPCRGLVSRFLFDPESHSCRHFFYGGCYGNGNNFRTIEECESRCQNPEAQTSPPPGPAGGTVPPEATGGTSPPPGPAGGTVPPEATGGTSPLPGPAGGAVPPEAMDGTSPPLGPAGAAVPPEATGGTSPLPGPAGGAVPPEATGGTAEMTVADRVEALGGARVEAQAHVNNTRPLHAKETPEQCLLPLEPGSCDGAQRRHFYNSTTRRCQSFSYSGCGGNGNNFSVRRLCIRTCVQRPRDHKELTRDKMIRIRRKNLDKFRQMLV